MEDVLPPPVLGALVAAPPQVHFITFTIGGVLLAVLAGAEPGLRRHVKMDVLQLARPMTDGVQILVLQGKKMFRKPLVREAGAHALPGRRADPKPSSAGLCSPHGPGVRFI